MSKPIETKEPGTLVKGKGVYAGVVNGYEVYAAPTDIMDKNGQRLTTNFNEMAKAIEELNEQNYLGHNDWVIPGIDVLRDALLKNKDQRDLNGTFDTTPAGEQSWAWSIPYLSSTDPNVVNGKRRLSMGYPTFPAAREISFSNGMGFCDVKSFGKSHCRPVRLEPVTG